MGVVVSRACEDFLCQTPMSAATLRLLIVKGWLKYDKADEEPLVDVA